jgi:hypothetical protein
VASSAARAWREEVSVALTPSGLEAGPDYPDPTHLPEELKFGHTHFAEAQDSQHNWALQGTITEGCVLD